LCRTTKARSTQQSGSSATLVRAIEENWAPPGSRRRSAEERREAEQSREEAERRDREEAEIEDAARRRRAAQDALWDSMDADEQARLDDEARESLFAGNPGLRGNPAFGGSGRIFGLMLEQERRLLLDRRVDPAPATCPVPPGG
jgi:hypothetical protein